MIDNIYGSKHTEVTGIVSSPYISPGAQGAGMVRYNTNTQHLEVYDGLSWLSLDRTATVSLKPEANAAIDWALKKMQEEELYRELAEKYPAVADARAKVAQAEAELSVIAELVK